MTKLKVSMVIINVSRVQWNKLVQKIVLSGLGMGFWTKVDKAWFAAGEACALNVIYVDSYAAQDSACFGR